MIPLELQDALKLRLEKDLETLLLIDPVTRERNKKVSIFTQHLPNPEKKGDVSYFPCLVIRLRDGDSADPNEPDTIRVAFIASTFDRSSDQQGYRDVLTIMQRVHESLQRNPLVDDRFQRVPPSTWAYDDEDTAPYFYAGLETNWEIPRYLREDLEGLV